jgi:hypothetical protein
MSDLSCFDFNLIIVIDFFINFFIKNLCFLFILLNVLNNWRISFILLFSFVILRQRFVMLFNSVKSLNKNFYDLSLPQMYSFIYLSYIWSHIFQIIFWILKIFISCNLCFFFLKMNNFYWRFNKLIILKRIIIIWIIISILIINAF